MYNLGSNKMKRTITITDRDGDIVIMLGSGPGGDVEVATEMSREGDTLILRDTHVEGSVGYGEFREFARELGRQQGVKEVVIYGGIRTSGANPGHAPRPVKVEVD